MLLAIVEEIQWILDSLVPAGGRRGSRLTAHNRESCGEGAHGSCDRGASLTGCRRTDELCDEVSFEVALGKTLSTIELFHQSSSPSRGQLDNVVL